MAHYKVFINKNDQLGGTQRLVTLKGTGLPARSLLANIILGSSRSQDLFINDGWDLVAFEITGGLTMWSTIYFNIRARVNNAYSDEDVRQRAIQLLSENFEDVRLAVINEQTIANQSIITNNQSSKSILDSINPTTLFGTSGVTVGVVATILVLIVILKRD